MNDLALSFELFPPKGETAANRFWRTVGQIETMNPAFVSLTRGAFGGTAKDDVLLALNKQLGCKLAAHLTTRGASKEQLAALLESWYQEGIRELVLLRGDGETQEALNSALELQALAASIKPFGVRVAGYPETHPLAASSASDIDIAKAKSDLGAKEILSQFFFEPKLFLDYRERCAKAGVTATVVPGILPVADFCKLQQFAKACGASIPKSYFDHFEGLEGNTEVQQRLGIDLAQELCQTLINEGVDRLHLYTLNIPNFATKLAAQLQNLSLHPPLKLVG